MTAKKRLGSLLSMLWLVLAVGGCRAAKTVSDSSSVALRVITEIPEVATINLKATLTTPGTSEATKDAGTFTVQQAARGLVLLPHSSSNDTFRVTAAGFPADGTTAIVSMTVSSRFNPGKASSLTIVLAAACKNVTCADPSRPTCVSGSCQEIPVVAPVGPEATSDARAEGPTVDAAGESAGGDAAADAPGEASHDVPAADCDPSATIANGERCSCSGACASGKCVEGVCCNSACTDLCHSCNLPTLAGICSPVPGGEKPVHDGDCPAADVISCGRNGKCDGAGACQRFPDGTICQAGQCDQSGTGVVNVKACANGACADLPRRSCAPFACDSGKKDCFELCTGDDQCAAGVACKISSCGLKMNGFSCSKATDCVSGFCADGVCCDGACDQPCHVCNNTGRPGTCGVVGAGQKDPRGKCVDQGKSSCGTTGTCDAGGSCALYPQGTMCAGAICLGGASGPARGCDGNGSCAASTPIPCTPYQCAGATGACIKTCGADGDCVSPNKCVNGTCGLRGAGQSCAGNNECVAGLSCADGVCCDKPCAGVCQACNLLGHLGVCTNSPPNSASPPMHPACVRSDPTTCAANGQCDGNGGCQKHAAGTPCGAAASCDATSNQQQAPSACDGSGGCVAAARQTCAPFTCASDQCKTSCSSPVDCAPGAICDNHRMPNPAHAGLPNPTSYVDNNDGTVTDNLTGLIWEKVPAPTATQCTGTAEATTTFPAVACTQAQARAYCASKAGGPWRLPTRIELVSLVDYTVGYPGPAINLAYFPGTPGDAFWTSTMSATQPGYAWYVVFNGLSANTIYVVTGPSRVRCVR